MPIPAGASRSGPAAVRAGRAGRWRLDRRAVQASKSVGASGSRDKRGPEPRQGGLLLWRRAAAAIGERGRPFHVAVRVATTFESCRNIGYDLETWVDEKLCDLVIAGGNSGTDPGATYSSTNSSSHTSPYSTSSMYPSKPVHNMPG